MKTRGAGRLRVLAVGLLAIVTLIGCDQRPTAQREPVRWSIKADPALVSSVAPRQSAPGRTPVWVHDGNDGRLTVFGVFHAIKTNTDWAPPALLKACANSDLVFVEEPDLKPGDIEALKALSPAEPPWTGLTPRERERLTAILKRLGLRLEDYSKIDAGRMVLHLESLIAASRGEGGAPLAERWVVASCANGGKTLRALEPAGTYTRAIMTMTPAQRQRMLRDFIATPTRHPDIQAKLYAAWSSGNLAAMEKLADEDAQRWEALGVGAPVLKDRNIAWAKTIKQSLARDRSVLVVVGLAHVVGPDNLIEALTREGVKVQQPRGRTATGNPLPNRAAPLSVREGSSTDK